MPRVLVTIAPGVEAARVVGELRRHGAATAAQPTPELPGVIIAEVPQDAVAGFLGAAAAIPGVSSAERDALRFTEPDDGPVDGQPDLPPEWSSTQDTPGLG